METKLTPSELLGPRIEGPHSKQFRVTGSFLYTSNSKVARKFVLRYVCSGSAHKTVQLQREAGPGRKGGKSDNSTASEAHVGP